MILEANPKISDLMKLSGLNHKAVAMLHAYFDETGTDGRADIVLIAGFIAPAVPWDEAEAEWLLEFSRYAGHGPEWFHLTDIINQSKQYERIDTANANHLITQMAKIVGRHHLSPIYAGVSKSAFANMKKSAAFKKRFPDPLTFCFEALVCVLADWSALHAQREKVNMTYSLDPKQVPQNWNNLIECLKRQAWYNKHIDGISFLSSNQRFGLQAADLLAHQMGYELERDGRTLALDLATSGKAPSGGWFDAAALKRAHQTFDNAGRLFIF